MIKIHADTIFIWGYDTSTVGLYLTRTDEKTILIIYESFIPT